MRCARHLMAGAAVILTVLPAPLFGQVTGAADIVTINSPDPAQGVRAVNAASGVNNQQANVGLIATGQTAASVGLLYQANANPAPAGGRTAQAEIAPGAFAGSSGWTAVNAVAGADNQQANLALFATGIEGLAVTDSILGQTRASPEPSGSQNGSVAAPDRSASLGEGAFADSSGLVQLNLVGGDRNSTANTFALSVVGSANPQ